MQRTTTKVISKTLTSATSKKVSSTSSKQSTLGFTKATGQQATKKPAQMARVAQRTTASMQQSGPEESKGAQAEQFLWQVADQQNYAEQLAQKGLIFNEAKKLVRMDGEPMPRLSQQEFEELGDQVFGYVQQQMKEVHRMREVWLGQAKGPKCNIFVSDDFESNASQCLVLIQGTGAVRAGIWARSVCINDDLTLGSMLPMIEFAKATGQSVIVLNPNMSTDPLSGLPIANSETMVAHCKHVWKTLINKKCPAESLAIVAHSAGGRCVAQLSKDYKEEFFARIKCLVFTDAYYHAMFPGLSRQELASLRAIGMHFKAYKTAHKEVGVPFKQQTGAIPEMSAGTSQHALTTGVSLQAILSFMTDRLA